MDSRSVWTLEVYGPSGTESRVMDPLTAAGAVDTVFSLLGYCMQGFVILSDAQNIGNASNILLCQLRVQELRLVQWADRVGLLKRGSLNDRLKPLEPGIKDILGLLKDHVEDTEKICGRYGFKLSVEPPTGGTTAAPTSGSDFLASTYIDEARKDILARAKLIKSKNAWPKRLWWAVMDSAKFEGLVKKIEGFVQNLWDLLSPTDTDAMMANLESIVSRVIALDTKISNLQTIGKALVRDDNAGRRDWLPQVASAANMRMARLQLFDKYGNPLEQNAAADGTASYLQAEELSFANISNFRGMVGNDDMGIATYDGQSVFVEYASYTIEQLDAREGSITSRKALLGKRAKNVAKFLNAPKHPVFRSLKCRGIAIGERKSLWTIAFICQLPNINHTRPKSLRSLLASSDESLPSVTARMGLSYKILQTIKYTHTAGWLHRNLRSENIVFFLPENPVGVTNPIGTLPEPTLVGFGYARLEEAAVSISETDNPARDIYAHPSHIWGVRYEGYMDIYSLGTILVELAEWMSLSRLVRSVIDVRKEDIGNEIYKVRPFLMEDAKSSDTLKLNFRMGDIFAKVTRLCLSADPVDANSGLSETEHALMTLDKAVGDLERCRV